MAEAEKVSAALAPVAVSGPPTDPPSHREPPKTPAQISTPRWKLPLYAGLGATFGFITGTGLYGEIRDEIGEFVLITLIVGAAAYLFFDPIMELLLHWLGSTPEEEEEPKDRKAFATLAIVGVTILLSALHHSLGKELEHEGGWYNAVYALLFFGGAAAVISHFWTRGAARTPSRARSFGAIAGAIAGFAIGCAGLYFMISSNRAPARLPGQSDGLYYGALALGAIGSQTLLWLIPGFLVGLAIDKKWKSPPTRAILLTLAAVSVGVLLLFGVASHSFPTLWLLTIQFVFLNLGWGIGPFLQHRVCDPHLDPSCAHALKPAHKESSLVLDHKGGQVVPFPYPPQGDPAHHGQYDDPQRLDPRPFQPAVVLLRPQGSRLWALVVLVAALGAGIWAYVTGVLRTDPEIIAEIESRFQQDSGLHQKLLTAASNDHVVTLIGSVDNGIQHTAAVQEASSVRGVKQLVDELQVVPPASAPVKTNTVTNTNTVLVPVGPGPVMAPPPAVVAVPVPVPVIRFGKSNKGHTSASKKSTPAPDAKQHKGFFHFLKRDKKDKPATNN